MHFLRERFSYEREVSAVVKRYSQYKKLESKAFFFKLFLQMSLKMFVPGKGLLQVPSWSCSQAVSKPVWHIPLLCVQWWTADGQRNCPKHVEFYSTNKFEKLVHLVGFIIRSYHGARSPSSSSSSSSSLGTTTLCGFWPALLFRSTIFCLYISLSNFSLSSSLNLVPARAISVLVFLLVFMNMFPIQSVFWRFLLCPFWLHVLPSVIFVIS